ncbi:MAG: hypothetical protein IPM74_08170 [Crocinitomicaceae bacterium]|nr:hypothetical protein [Crocinitomicaceae bacterium]MBK8925873.1 hypothetical protein [Crocinitomicaceae bacterium]
MKRLKLFILCFSTITAFSAGIGIETRYSSFSLDGKDEYLIEYLAVGPKNDQVVFEKTDSLFRNWKVTGIGYDGMVKLFISKERGIGWSFYLGEDSLKAMIARDYRNTSSPGMISMTASFIAGLFIVENFAPECNSYFKVYSLKNSWDADVEYTGKYALEISTTEPCGEGSWQAKTGKLKMPQKVLYASIFCAAMSQNIRHLFKNFVLP